MKNVGQLDAVLHFQLDENKNELFNFLLDKMDSLRQREVNIDKSGIQNVVLTII